MEKDRRMEKINNFYFYLREIFYVLSLALIIFVIMEIIKSKFVLGYLNLNLILVFWLASAIILMTIKPKL